MYENLRNEFMLSLMNNKDALNLDNKEVDSILSVLDTVAQDYEISEQDQQSLAIVDTTSCQKNLEYYIAVRRLEGLSENTLAHYRLVISKFQESISKPDDQVTANDIRAWLYTYSQNRGVISRTLEGYRGILDTYYGWLATNDYIPANPCEKIHVIKYIRKPRIALSQLELEYMRSACETPRDTALLEFLYSTGCRVSEVSKVKLSDINWADESVTVIGKGNKERIVYLNAKAINALRFYLDTREYKCEYLFCTIRAPHLKLGKSSIEHDIRRIARRREEVLPEGTQMIRSELITPHTFRHTVATNALLSGMSITDIKTILGHVYLSTTLIYASIADQSVKASHSKHLV